MTTRNPDSRFVAILRRLSARYEDALKAGNGPALGVINARYHRLICERDARVNPNTKFRSADLHAAAMNSEVRL